MLCNFIDPKKNPPTLSIFQSALSAILATSYETPLIPTAPPSPSTTTTQSKPIFCNYDARRLFSPWFRKKLIKPRDLENLFSINPCVQLETSVETFCKLCYYYTVRNLVNYLFAAQVNFRNVCKPSCTFSNRFCYMLYTVR